MSTNSEAVHTFRKQGGFLFHEKGRGGLSAAGPMKTNRPEPCAMQDPGRLIFRVV